MSHGVEAIWQFFSSISQNQTTSLKNGGSFFLWEKKDCVCVSHTRCQSRTGSSEGQSKGLYSAIVRAQCFIFMFDYLFILFN